MKQNMCRSEILKKELITSVRFFDISLDRQLINIEET